MTHSLIVPAHIIGGFQAGCICGYRTRIYAQFMALLFSGVDEGPIAARGGWPR